MAFKELIRRLFIRIPTNLVKNGGIIILLVIAYGVIGSHFIMNLNLFDSVYFSVTTMTTVGYGDIIPKTDIQKIFAMTLALAGVSTIAFVFTILLRRLTTKMTKISKGVKMMDKIDKMKGYYILCGYGRVGKIVFNELRARNQDIVLVEKDETVLKDLVEDDNLIIINRDATDDTVINNILKDNCKSVIVSTGSDVTNLFIVLTVSEISPDTWVVSRCNKSENIGRLYKSGANEVVSPEVSGGKKLYFEAVKPHLMRLTVRHSVDKIKTEMDIIIRHNCTMENIDYPFPGIIEPLSREIGAVHEDDVEKFISSLDKNAIKKESLENLYKAVGNIHSHWISAPNKDVLNQLIDDLESEIDVIGFNLSDKKIAKITRENLEGQKK